jgi:DNA-binding GntR family transcriptional regulator
LRTESGSHQTKHVSNPIKSVQEINQIRLYLADKPRDLLLFDLGTQTGIGMQKLLSIKVKNLIGFKEGEKVTIHSDIDKEISFTINKIIFDTFNDYLIKIRPKPEDYLFKSKKGQRPLNLSSVSNMIKGWFNEANIKNCYGAISLRKTWEFTQNQIPVEQKTTASKPVSVLKPVAIKTAQETIIKELFKAIITRKIPPGTKITPSEISKIFQVSLSPVRAALLWLEAKGFITSNKKSGCIVRELTITELYGLMQTRLILETGAVKLACEACTKETLAMIESIIERTKNASSYEEYDPLNRLFHQTLFRDLNNPMLLTIITDLYDRFAPYAALTFSELGLIPVNNPAKAAPEYFYVKILEGLRRKDIDMVCNHLEEMINRGKLVTEEIIKKSPPNRPSGADM